MRLTLSHIAIACPAISEVVKRLEVLSLKIEKSHDVPTEKVKVAFVPVEVSKDFRIELLEPTAPDSPVAKFLTTRTKGGLHHLSFEVEGIEAWKITLEEAGIEVLKPGIRKAARGRALFIHPAHMAGVLVELEEIQ
ncbi:MAG: VOC family protein [Deltaproteobacteria bacterium]|nr:VOC family protein [Deltaproteobacteria bacterium]MBI3296322.1 VOC family protein [Deltaproteobacteria bacterium]